MAQLSLALERLRACMNNEHIVSEPLSAYIIPTDDAHQVSGRSIVTCICKRSHV